MRRNVGFLISLLLLGESAAEGASLPLSPSRIPLPFLRGGSAVAATKTKKRKRRVGANPIGVVAGNAKRGLDTIGRKMQSDASNVGRNIGREWGKLTSSARRIVVDIPKLLPNPRRKNGLKSCKKLDDVCHAFSSVMKGNGEVDTAQLLRACRAHLALMKTGGASLRLVAKDLESNVQKAERVFKRSPREGRSLSSLLEREKERGIHDGDRLHEKSAAMGLLWIRRSLAFQMDLYADSLVSVGVHPKEAAYGAYDKHLSPFHGWALRKVFPASLSQMPEREAFIAKFGGITIEELNDEHDRVVAKKLEDAGELVGPADLQVEERVRAAGAGGHAQGLRKGERRTIKGTMLVLNKTTGGRPTP
eukprot:CAMPEP_0172534714 /NCGR_PEP_ID=MMETSP1067-20121228/6981_1 /TAXON_ID=265564 ORGANISM="Thalassiosira punctigera, Strain Tpunct2005C2" /NCGR_SAMPLE_ID=MMETSP1067 /ASSEMBLY_ACC=CAM_ASM_000444 /LENGTH=361 /DNA_ID=CAMNT_0013319535 /DNA_START=353 /DNA_END=1437 /DNA_ORIENTATION=-